MKVVMQQKKLENIISLVNGLYQMIKLYMILPEMFANSLMILIVDDLVIRINLLQILLYIAL